MNTSFTKKMALLLAVNGFLGSVYPSLGMDVDPQGRQQTLPADFNWKGYLLLNPGVEPAIFPGHTLETWAQFHYLTWGRNANLQYNDALPLGFDWRFYIQTYPAVEEARDWPYSQEDWAKYHYMTWGRDANLQFMPTETNNDPQKPSVVRVFQYANAQKKECVSAALQLNLDAESSRRVFEMAETFHALLPKEGIRAEFGTNSPHVTLETFNPKGRNLSSQQLAFLKGRLVPVCTEMGISDLNKIEVLPVELLLIAKFDGQDNQYYTKANIAELSGHKGNLTGCILTAHCNVKQGGKVEAGNAFLKMIQPRLREGLSQVELTPGKFDNPLCHVTLMDLNPTGGVKPVVDLCNILFSQVDFSSSAPFAVDKMVLNPMFASKDDNGKDPFFDVARKIEQRNKADWAQEPRAYVSMLDLEGQEAEIKTRIESEEAHMKTHLESMARTEGNIRRCDNDVKSLEAIIKTHATYMAKTQKNIDTHAYKAGFEATLDKQKKKLADLNEQLELKKSDRARYESMRNRQRSFLESKQAQLKAMKDHLAGLRSQK